MRKKWGFAGFVVSDWGGINDRVAGLKAGTNLEMPGSGRYNTNKVMQAVESGELSADQLDESATEVLAVILRAHAGHKAGVRLDADGHHALARKAASESMVLLKNVDRLLPLNIKRASSESPSSVPSRSSRAIRVPAAPKLIPQGFRTLTTSSSRSSVTSKSLSMQWDTTVRAKSQNAISTTPARRR